MATAKARSSELKKAQILSIHNLGYYGYVTNQNDDKVSADIYLHSKPSGDKYQFIDNVSGISFYVEQGDYIKELVIRGLFSGLVDKVVIDIDVTADKTGLMSIKNVYGEL